MFILALETATPVGSIALVDEEKIISSRYFDLGLQHSQRLFVEIEDIFKTTACALSDIDAIAVSIGPGSFTGLRIGLSAAKGLCLVGDKALVAVSTAEALAARMPFARYPVCVMLDARRQEVYTALYDTSSGPPRILSALRPMAPEALLQECAGQKTIFVGDAVSTYGDLIAIHPDALTAPFYCARPEAGSTGWLACAKMKAGETADLETIEPEYIRKPNLKVGAKPLAAGRRGGKMG